MIDINKLEGGAVGEMINAAFQDVLRNIDDRNTSHKFKRQILIALTFESDEKREIPDLSTSVKTKLAPCQPSETKVVFGRDSKTGRFVVNELKSGIAGQTYIETNAEQPFVAADTGEPIAGGENHVIDFRKKALEQG